MIKCIKEDLWTFVTPGLSKFDFAWLPAEAHSASSTGPECSRASQSRSLAAILSLAIMFVLPPLQTASFLLTGRYVSNCLHSPSKLCIQVAQNTSTIYCTSINPLGPCALPTLKCCSTSQPFLWLTRFPYFFTKKLEHFTTWKFASHTPCPHLETV